MNENIRIMLIQLGGANKLRAMLGADKFLYNNSENSLTFEFRGFQKSDLFTISYNYGSDLYNMKFEKIKYSTEFHTTSISNIKEIKTFNDIFCEDLKSVFEEFTGLYISLQ